MSTHSQIGSIIEALASGQAPAEIARRHGMTVVELADLAGEGELAEAIERVRALLVLHEQIVLDAAQAKALTVLTAMMDDASLPASLIEARARETRRKSCADVLRCRKGAARRAVERGGDRDLPRRTGARHDTIDQPSTRPASDAEQARAAAPHARGISFTGIEPAPMLARESRQQRRGRERDERKARQRAARMTVAAA